MLGVAAPATNLRSGADGRLLDNRGGEFLSLGVYAGKWVPMDPEDAVVQAARDAERLVSGVPTFRRAGNRYAAAHGTWSFPVETAQRVRGELSGQEREVGAVHYGHFRGFRTIGLQAGDPRTESRSRDERYNYALSESSGLLYVNLVRRVDTPFELEVVSRVRP